MEVILIKDMEKLGYANDIVNVKPGYANNYLIPQGYAKAATAAAKKVLAENLRQRAHKDAKILADAQALAETIANLPLTIAVKAEEGKLFGTVTATDLAEALAAKGINVDRKVISVEAIKTVGEYEATARLHKEVKATIKFSVVAADALRADGAHLSAQPDAQLRPEERAGHRVEHLHLSPARAGDPPVGLDGARQTAPRYGALRAGDLPRRGHGAQVLYPSAATRGAARRQSPLTGRQRHPLVVGHKKRVFLERKTLFLVLSRGLACRCLVAGLVCCRLPTGFG